MMSSHSVVIAVQ